MENQSPIEIRITHPAFLKLKYFIEECETEVSGFGKVRVVKVEEETTPAWGKEQIVQDQYLEIYDLEILTQQVSGVHSTIEEEDLAKFLYEKQKKGESVADYKVWWHSHVDMAAFFSGTDTGTIDGSTEFPYLISIVGNKAGELKVRFDLYSPLRLTFADVELKVGQHEDEALRKVCKSEIKKKVKTNGFRNLFGTGGKFWGDRT